MRFLDFTLPSVDLLLFSVQLIFLVQQELNDVIIQGWCIFFFFYAYFMQRFGAACLDISKHNINAASCKASTKYQPRSLNIICMKALFLNYCLYPK
jgi:hypothetical protein